MAQVGKTKSQGWEIGVRRTFAISTHHAWELLTTQPGLGYWLGQGVSNFQKGASYQTDAATTGEIRSYNEGSLIRLTWQPCDWNFSSTVQLRVLPAKKGATISIHHEKLDDGERRAKMQRHWSTVLDQLAKLIDES